MIDDDDMDHLQFRIVPESVEDEFVKTVRVRVAARRAFMEVDTDARLRVALRRRLRPGRLTFKPGDLFYFNREQGIGGRSPGMATVASHVGLGHYHIDYGARVFKQSADQLRHVSERE